VGWRVGELVNRGIEVEERNLACFHKPEKPFDFLATKDTENTEPERNAISKFSCIREA